MFTYFELYNKKDELLNLLDKENDAIKKISTILKKKNKIDFYKIIDKNLFVLGDYIKDAPFIYQSKNQFKVIYVNNGIYVQLYDIKKDKWITDVPHYIIKLFDDLYAIVVKDIDYINNQIKILDLKNNKYIKTIKGKYRDIVNNEDNKDSKYMFKYYTETKLIVEQITQDQKIKTIAKIDKEYYMDYVDSNSGNSVCRKFNRKKDSLENKYYILNSKGELLKEFNYHHIFKLKGNYYKVKKGKKYGLIDVNGNIIEECKYDKISIDKNGEYEKYLLKAIYKI